LGGQVVHLFLLVTLWLLVEVVALAAMVLVQTIMVVVLVVQEAYLQELHL
jgi:hypothetical protein